MTSSVTTLQSSILSMAMRFGSRFQDIHILRWKLAMSVSFAKADFTRLFNVLLPAEDPAHENYGVQWYHEQLTLRMRNHTWFQQPVFGQTRV